MELPKHIKDLYRHWDTHTTERAHQALLVVPKEMQWFIHERIRIWEKKTQGKQPPFTQDPILSTYRFCNIFRELDRQTIEIHKMLNPRRSNFPLWLMNMFYARMTARPETMRITGLLSFDRKKNEVLYKKLMASPRPRYGTPYVFPVSTIMKSDTPTRELLIAHHLPRVMKKVAQEIQSWEKMPVYDGVKTLLPLFGFNLSFLWTEVLIDVAYQFPQHIDLFGRFPIGPGSAPTFAKLSQGKDPSLFAQQLGAKRYTSSITYKGKPLGLSAENWEGIGCEYRKYTNLKAGHGRRRIYKSSK